jgi:hypothetical protein
MGFDIVRPCESLVEALFFSWVVRAEGRVRAPWRPPVLGACSKRRHANVRSKGDRAAQSLLSCATDSDEREIISQLLAKQQARLLKMECKVRGG